MPRNEYVSISIPRSLSDEIQKLLESGETTYVSKTDFIKDAIRIRLRKLNRNV